MFSNIFFSPTGASIEDCPLEAAGTLLTIFFRAWDRTFAGIRSGGVLWCGAKAHRHAGKGQCNHGHAQFIIVRLCV